MKCKIFSGSTFYTFFFFGGGSNQLIYQSFITWEGGGGRGGVGVLDIDLPIFSPEQALKPVPLLRKANSR